jgi:flagellar hook-associated protein 1
MPDFTVGLSALRSSQLALDVISNNIANANTEGYHRQSAYLASLPSERSGRFLLGRGVSVNFIERARHQVTEAALTNVIADVRSADQRLALERQIEAALMNGANSLGEQLDQFFGDMTRLASAPDEWAQRSAVIETGRRLAATLRESSAQLTKLRSAVRYQMQQEVAALNGKLRRLGKLNQEIQSHTAQGFQPNGEMDERDKLLNEIAEITGVSRFDHISGDLNLTIGNVSIQQSNRANQFSIKELPDGRLEILVDDSDRSVDLQSGSLAALLEVHNSTIPKYLDRLDAFAANFMRQFDAVHASGVGQQGPFQSLTGTRSVRQPNTPLAVAGAAFELQAGDLTISIVDPQGNRRTEVISIDPAVDSLQDVAQRISGIAELSSLVDTNTNQLRIVAQSGYRFDFTGSLETHPRSDNFTGSSVPRFAGVYTGEANQQLRFDIEGSGQVGISESLFVNVFREDGSLVERVSIGRGYEAGSTIAVADGVQISFPHGDVIDGDYFNARLVAKPDETGLLAALGLNSFFRGVDARTMQVEPGIVRDHSRFAMGHSGAAADNANLLGMLALKDYTAFGGKLTFTEYLNEINTEIGFQVSSDAALSESLQSMKRRIQQDRDAYSGVDVNEELVHLQQFQKSYQAAVRIIQTTDDVLNELFSILR